MTTLSQTHWNVLSFIKHYERQRVGQVPRNSDIQHGCGLESRAQTRDVLDFLERKGLVETISRRINGHTVLYARSHRQTTGTVGVSYAS